MKLFILLAVGFMTCAAQRTNDIHKRIKRQDTTDVVIDSIFQVPIQILTATNSLVKNSRPIIMQVRERFMQNHGGGSHGNKVGGLVSSAFQFNQQNDQNKRLQDQINAQRTRAAKVGGYKASRDGTFFRI